MPEVRLPGGFVSDVVRVGATVRRTQPANAGFVHELLDLFAQRGWAGAPRFLGWNYLDLGPSIAGPADAVHGLRIMCDAYGLADRGDLIDTIMWWLDRCWRGIEAAAATGDPAGVRLRAAGVIQEVRAARAWVAGHQHELQDGIR